MLTLTPFDSHCFQASSKFSFAICLLVNIIFTTAKEIKAMSVVCMNICMYIWVLPIFESFTSLERSVMRITNKYRG